METVKIKDNIGFYEEFEIYDYTKMTEPCIYFLIQETPFTVNRVKREIVYVGQSKRGLERIFEHKDKKFNRISIIPCKTELLDQLEEFAIKKYMPYYNQAIKKGEERKRIKK